MNLLLLIKITSMFVVVLIVVLAFLIRLQIHLNRLEERIKKLEPAPRPKQSTASTSTPFIPPAQQPTSAPLAAAEPVTTPQHVPPATPVSAADLPPTREPAPTFTPVTAHATKATEPDEPSAVISWLQENTLIKVGAIIFFLGAVWFVSYAITQGWISPLMRIVLGVALGAAILGIGHLRRHASLEQYLTLTTLGGGIIIASVYVGQLLFTLFDPLAALVMLIITIGYVVYVSVLTNTQWLSITSAIAALVAPLLTNAPDGLANLFFLYLGIVSVSFLLVQRFRAWRGITLTLLLGISYYQAGYYSAGAIDATTLWWYVLFFTALFYGASVSSLLRDRIPRPIDITILGVTAVNFTTWVWLLVSAQSLVTFTAAFVVALTGYGLYQRNASARIVAIFTGLAGLLALLATSFTFDGYSLAVAYALEVSVALGIATYLRFDDRIVTGVACLYVLPVVTTIGTYRSSDWDTGVLHPTGYALYAIIITSTWLSVWLLSQYLETKHALTQTLAAWFTGIAYGTFILTSPQFWIATQLSLEVIDPDQADTIAKILTYLSWLVVSVVIILINSVARLGTGWQWFGLLSLVLPFVLSLDSFLNGTWEQGVGGADAVATYLVTATTLGLWGWYTYQHLTQSSAFYQTASLAMFFVFWSQLTILAWQIWHSVFTGDVAIVLTYVSWALLIYGLGYIIHQLQYPSGAWLTLHSLLGLPVLASFTSFNYGAWTAGAADINAAGLYVLTTLFVILSVSYRRELMQHPSADHLAFATRAFAVLAGGYGVTLVWLVTHATLAVPETAVAVALFIYTVAGLICYLMSKATGRHDLKIASAVLLSGVVLRLVLVDVWAMEGVWRIVTFMGIGALFILTALIEKPFQRTEETSFIPTATQQPDGRVE